MVFLQPITVEGEGGKSHIGLRHACFLIIVGSNKTVHTVSLHCLNNRSFKHENGQGRGNQVKKQNNPVPFIYPLPFSC